MTSNTISQQGYRYYFDVVIVGSGIAALSYALELSHLHPETRIALLTKCSLEESNSHYAQGGIAAALSIKKSVALHLKDTVKAGAGLCDPQHSQFILEKGASSIEFLQEQGVMFDCNAEGEFSCGLEAGHSERRIYHCSDKTGAAIIQALIKRIRKIKSISLLEYHVAIHLILNKKNPYEQTFAEVIGLYALQTTSELIHTFISKIVVLATGGAGKVYHYTTNPDTATGDGVAMAYRAGARIANLEFYQFHPTLFYNPTLKNFLITEALRGEGAYLIHPQTGERFMKYYAPDVMELATRDIVASAIFNEMEKSGCEFVYLDIRHKDKKFLQARFPNIYETLENFGCDLSKDLIPIVPAAHYMCGGIFSDSDGTTDLPRLYAIGETAFTGLHGANRLASNSLLEGVVMGREAAIKSRVWLKDIQPNDEHIEDWIAPSVVDKRRSIQISAHWRGLRTEMSAYAGIIRTQAGLEDLLKLILLRKNMIEKYYWDHLITRDLIELRNILLVAELMVRNALKRKESRGNHYREDYPQSKEVAEISISVPFNGLSE